MRRWFKVLCAALCGLLVWVPAALAQSVPRSGYGGAAGDLQGGLGGDVAGGGSGVLPFTGLDLALLVGGGLMLLIVGVVARRMGRAAS